MTLTVDMAHAKTKQYASLNVDQRATGSRHKSSVFTVFYSSYFASRLFISRGVVYCSHRLDLISSHTFSEHYASSTSEVSLQVGFLVWLCGQSQVSWCPICTLGKISKGKT